MPPKAEMSGAVDAPALMGRYDVVVVGAGILGAASAFHLKRNSPNRRVLLLDRFGAPGQGNTGRSNAMFRNTFTSNDNQILSDSTIECYLKVQSEGTDLGLQRIGYLWLMSNAQLSASEGALRLMDRNGIHTRRFARAEIEERMPGLRADLSSDGEAELMGLPDVDGGVFGPKCGRLDPDKLVRHYVREFTRIGGLTAFSTNVDRLLVGPSKRLGIDGEPFVWQESRVEGVQVSGAVNGAIGADAVVLACGAWGNQLLGPVGIDGHVGAKKRQLFSVSTKGSPPLGRLLHTKGFNDLGLPPLVVLPKAGVHFRPAAEEGDFWIGCEDEVNRPLINVPERSLEGYEAERSFYERSVSPVLSAYFPQFKSAAVKAMWAGLYSYNTLDYLPFVFRQGNLIAVGGDSGSGIMKGDSLGRIVDAVYREADEVSLYGGVQYDPSRIGFERRRVEREGWVI